METTAMGTSRGMSGQAYFQLRSGRIRAGIVLAVAGGVLGTLGSIIAGTEMAMATRRWLQEGERPPAEVLREKAHQVVRASQAGSSAVREAWQHNGEAVPAATAGE